MSRSAREDPGGDTGGGDALDVVVEAALERALLDGTDARRYFALAGALERARTSGPSATGGDAADRDVASGGDVGPLGAALASTVAVGALDSVNGGIDPGAWSPGGGRLPEELVAAGARAARRRFDVDAAVVASRSGVSREKLAAAGDENGENR